MIFLYFAVLAASFALLFKSADFFVDGACGIAKSLNVSKMLVGIVLVGMATTAPEFGVSVWAASLGKPEIALGNAIGSVLCDDGIALALAALLAPTVILVNCRILKVVGVFLLAIDGLAFLLASNGTIGRLEGGVLITLLVLYFVILLRKKAFRSPSHEESLSSVKANPPSGVLGAKCGLRRPILLFSGGIAGVIVTTRFVIWAAENIADHFGIADTVIGLTVIAIGTSLPEISTCITAARKGEGEIAVGNILGADVLNVLWIIGAASLVNPIHVDVKVIHFTFPAMIVIVAVMLGSLAVGCRLNKGKGVLLISLYGIYMFLTILLFT